MSAPAPFLPPLSDALLLRFAPDSLPSGTENNPVRRAVLPLIGVQPLLVLVLVLVLLSAEAEWDCCFWGAAAGTGARNQPLGGGVRSGWGMGTGFSCLLARGMAIAVVVILERDPLRRSVDGGGVLRSGARNQPLGGGVRSGRGMGTRFSCLLARGTAIATAVVVLGRDTLRRSVDGGGVLLL
ncbi:hypothetical protein F5X96DRAFT_657852 [Biscogniauxia mediterranea]|nr:hypothetical protein F5X96DRAFT_657852 [Biscogniauxia mediterranea]